MLRKAFVSVCTAVCLAAGFSTVVTSGCGSGGFSCDGPPKCSGDPAIDKAVAQACKDALNGPCGSKFKEAADCLYSATTCVMNKSQTDLSMCTTQSGAYAQCTNSTGDGGMKPDSGSMDSGTMDSGMDSGTMDSGTCKGLGASCLMNSECCTKLCNPQTYVCQGG